jgi:hypothetical protein
MQQDAQEGVGYPGATRFLFSLLALVLFEKVAMIFVEGRSGTKACKEGDTED